jgi:hypothetical protein
MKQWYTLSEVESHTGLPIHNIKEAIRASHLPASREGSRYVISHEDLILYMVEARGISKVRARWELAADEHKIF